MKTLATADIRSQDVDQIESFALAVPSAEVRALLLSIAQCLRDGSDLAVIDGKQVVMLTPSEVATRLGMSRTHLYKLLDRGEIPFERVGRDRRILLEDLVEFETKRQAARRELAEQFAHRARSEAAAVDDLAELL